MQGKGVAATFRWGLQTLLKVQARLDADCVLVSALLLPENALLLPVNAYFI